MPEGDTIWRVAARLRERLQGRTVKRVRPESLGRLRGLRLETVEPVGKHLLMRFSGGWTLHSHMRMTGSWHLYRQADRWLRPERFARAVIDFGEWVAVCFSAPVLELVRDPQESIGHLGPDVLKPQFPLESVVRRARAVGSSALGELLLDQRVCCGIGNVYKCEALWQLGLDPWTPSSQLDDGELGELFETARSLMARNVAPHSGFPRTFPGSGRAAVHGRRGRPCPRCGASIEARQQGEQGRWTYWCPSCQTCEKNEAIPWSSGGR